MTDKEINAPQSELETAKQQVIQLEQERDALKVACDGAEQAIRYCPALKEWGPSTPEHLASRVAFLCNQYDGCVHTLGQIADQRDTLISELFRLRSQKVEGLPDIRKAINACFGGMGWTSAIWGSSQYDKGHSAGVLAALTAFDTACKAIPPTAPQPEES